MPDAHDFGVRPRIVKKKKSPSVHARAVVDAAPDFRTRLDDHGRSVSYGFGVLMLLLGGGMVAGYQLIEQGPGKLCNLFMAGGVVCVLAGIGLFIHPLDEKHFDAFQYKPHPISVFRVMPIFWKMWVVVIFAAMIAAFIFSQNMARIGR